MSSSSNNSSSLTSASPNFSLAEFKEPEKTSDLIHKIGHEIGNPLTAIISLGSLIQRILEENSLDSDPAKISSYINSMLKESWRVSQLNERLVLLFSEKPNNSELSPLPRVTERALEKIKGEERFSNLKANLQFSSEDLSIQLESSQLQAVISELIANAWREQDLAGSGLPIEISCFENPDGNVIFEVENFYQSEKELKLKELFHPFVKGDPYKKGSGLGLTICWAVIERAGGKFTISTSEPGAIDETPLKKFKASFSIPKKVLEINLGAQNSGSEGAAKSSNKLDSLNSSYSLLLISDNDKLAQAISKILALTLGKRTSLNTEIINTHEAYSKNKDFFSQDAALACWQVNNKTAEDLFTMLNSQNKNLTRSFAFFSATESEDLKNFSNINNLSFISFPFSPEDILNLVIELLTSRN